MRDTQMRLSVALCTLLGIKLFPTVEAFIFPEVSSSYHVLDSIIDI